MSDTNNAPNPLMEQAVKGFFHLPWPRKPINKAKGSGKGHARSGMRQPRLRKNSSKFL